MGSIIARERELELKTHFSASFINSAKDYLFRLSVLKEAQIAVDTGGVHAMHDPTEGGIATAVRELATAAEVGAEVWIDRLIVPEKKGTTKTKVKKKKKKKKKKKEREKKKKKKKKKKKS